MRKYCLFQRYQSEALFHLKAKMWSFALTKVSGMGIAWHAFPLSWVWNAQREEPVYKWGEPYSRDLL